MEKMDKGALKVIIIGMINQIRECKVEIARLKGQDADKVNSELLASQEETIADLNRLLDKL